MESNNDWEKGYPVKPKQLSNDTLITIPEAYDPDSLKKLLNFSVNNPDLVKLENLINSFNPLKILGVSEYEIRHSNVLAWLFDPNGHHGLNDTLFKNFLLEVLKENKKDSFPQIKNVFGTSFTDLRIMREYKNIDLLAVSSSNDIVVVIENKINATEHDKQLSKYADIIDKKYKDYSKVFVLLTLDGIAPKGNDRYVSFSHEQLHEIVWSAVEVRKDYMHTKVYDFICQYLQIIGEKTMQSNEFVGICSQLYKEHGPAIKMIMDYGRPKLPISSMKNFHDKTKTISYHSDKDNVPVYYSLIPKDWSGKVPVTNTDKSDRYLVFVYINFNDYEKFKIGMSIRVGKFPDTNERERFITELRKASDADKDKLLTVKVASKSYTTVFSQTISLKHNGNEECELDDYDTITDILIKAYGEDNMKKAIAIVTGVVKKFKFNDPVE